VSPLVEYYIIESWGTWRPPGGQGAKGSANIGGTTYDIYETTRNNQPSIKGNATFQQYWSVRQQKTTSGTIPISKHFDTWESKGMRLGKMYEIALVTEGYQSSGSCDVTKMEIKVGESSGDSSSVTKTPAPARSSSRRTTTATPRPTSRRATTTPRPTSRRASTTSRSDSSEPTTTYPPSKASFDFEDGTDDWNGKYVNEGPRTTSDWASKGKKSISVDIEMNKFRHYIKKVGNTSLNASSIKANVKAGDKGEFGEGLEAKIFVRHGSRYTTTYGTAKKLKAGDEAVLELDLANVDTTNVREFGVQFVDAEDGSGITTVYLDDFQLVGGDSKPATTTKIATATKTPATTKTTAVTEKPAATATPKPAEEPKKYSKYVALTFDDGPDNRLTAKVLDKLKKYDAKATFFMIGQKVNSSTSAIVKRVVDEGHEIGNHSWAYDSLNNKSAGEIQKSIEDTNKAIKDIAGVTPKFFRPPNLATSQTMYQTIKLPFCQGVIAQDWNGGSATTAQARANLVLNGVKDGSIVLMHDVQNEPHPTPEALDIIIPKLQSQGYGFVTLTDLFKAKGKTPQLGTMLNGAF
jgi:peptidoglycan/xylan/chitin deacetylase (PgdA/CDA1 family)